MSWNQLTLLRHYRDLRKLNQVDISVDLKEEEILGEDISGHWYYRSKASALLDYVGKLNPQSILDVGAGSGFFSKELLRKTDAKDALCIDTSYKTERNELIDRKPVRYSTQSGPADVDLVLMMDVLEHVDNDVGLLCEYVDKVPAGTHFLITVPAFSFLWSGHDVFLGHYRRYTLNQIEEVAGKSGLIVEHGSYYFGLVFPLAAALRLLGNFPGLRNHSPSSQLKMHSPFTNAILKGICTIDRIFLHVNRVAGLTSFCLARKP